MKLWQLRYAKVWTSL